MMLLIHTINVTRKNTWKYHTTRPVKGQLRSSVRLGLGIVTGRRIGGGESDEIDEDPAGKETHGPQVVENVAVDEAVHNAVHHTALPRFQRPGNEQYHATRIL
jgi:hypothetical protein